MASTIVLKLQAEIAGRPVFKTKNINLHIDHAARIEKDKDSPSNNMSSKILNTPLQWITTIETLDTLNKTVFTQNNPHSINSIIAKVTVG